MTIFNLGIDHPDALNPNAANYAILSLDVPDDFPISVTKDGRIVSIYSQNTWDLSPYNNVLTRLRFLTTKGGRDICIDAGNLAIFKKVTLYSMYMINERKAVSSIVVIFSIFKYVVKLCIQNSIVASDLHRYPKVYLQLSELIPPSQWFVTKLFLYRLHRDRDLLGFNILNYEQIDEIGRCIANYVPRQTAYIPERIHNYVIDRCAEVIKSYLDNEQRISILYKICVSTCLLSRQDFGADTPLAKVRELRVQGKKRNISALEHYTGKSLLQLAEENNVLNLISEWHGSAKARGTVELRCLSSYLSSVCAAAQVLIAALSGMRDKEITTLRMDCFETRNDPLLGLVCLLKGQTTKTLKDRSTYWVSSPLAGSAVAAAKSVAILRSEAARANPRFNTNSVSTADNLLFGRATDPWNSAATFNDAAAYGTELAKRSSSSLAKCINTLFDRHTIIITESDLSEAMRLNLDLDPNLFYVGKVWPLRWHQFRRTLVCRALGSGVSIASVAWQLKHAGPAMSQYYGNNYFNIEADPKLREEFERTQVEILLVRSKELLSSNFVPVAGIEKSRVIRIIAESDVKALEHAAITGKLSFKRTALGVCTSSRPCANGGWEHITDCVSCMNALADRANKFNIKRMIQIIEADISECRPSETLLRESLEKQLSAAKAVINVLG